MLQFKGKAGYVAQGSNTARDMARAPLFAYVNEGKLKNIKTYALFMRLLDNYEMSTGVSETVTSEELIENDLFLNAILETEVMKCAHKYLVSKGHSPSDQQQFKRQLYNMWFRLYHRDRSGGEQFELGKKKKKGCFDLSVQPDEDDHVLNLQFSWKGLVKPVGSSFIGVSPEFEVALFTILFLASTEKVTTAVVKVDEYLLEMVVYRQGRSIGTSYPKLLSSNNRDL
nr:poly(U)-specific endoribonuclease-C-like [Oncorhynchus nerka]